MMKTPYFEEIGHYFKEKRLVQGMTQEEVAGFLGYTSKQIISNWERGLCSPPLHQVSSLITLYNLNANEVLNLFMHATQNDLAKRFGIKNRSKSRKSS